MYKGPHGFKLRSAKAPGGWTIRNMQDVETALYTFPEFQTVYSGFLMEAVANAIRDRGEFKNITELAQYLSENYI